MQAPRPARLDSRGRRIIRTAPWYDAKGPRSITVTPIGEGRLRTAQGFALAGLVLLLILGLVFWPILVFGLAAILGGKGTRVQLRAAVTRFLDRLGQAA